MEDINQLRFRKYQKDRFVTSDIDDTTTANVTYIGKMDADGIWMIKKIDETSGTSMTYATSQNNSSYSTYSSAWTDRASLTYGSYSEAF